MSKKIKTLLLSVIIISGIIIVSGYFYYREINRAEDPRIVDARNKMTEYNKLMGENEIDLALLVLDQVEDIYLNTPGYAESYEPGVIQNNRGSVFLIKTETEILNKKETDPENIILAKKHIQKSIDIYTNWLDKITPLSRDQILNMIQPFFPENDPAFTGLNINKIIEKRVDDIIVSKLESKRRLSVSYTNLAIILRYEGNLEEAKEYYEKALKLWPENHVAKNNLNRLMGLPQEKRNIIKELFYKERDANP